MLSAPIPAPKPAMADDAPMRDRIGENVIRKHPAVAVRGETKSLRRRIRVGYFIGFDAGKRSEHMNQEDDAPMWDRIGENALRKHTATAVRGETKSLRRRIHVAYFIGFDAGKRSERMTLAAQQADLETQRADFEAQRADFEAQRAAFEAQRAAVATCSNT